MSPLYIGNLIDYGQKSSDPTSPSPTEGSRYWNTAEDRNYVYNGSKWEKLAAGTLVFDDSNTTHYWNSDDISSATSWPAQKGGSGANFVASVSTDEISYSAGDSNMNGQKSLTTVAGNSGLRTSTQSEDTYWNGSEAVSVMVVMRKNAQTSGGTHGDGLFVQTRNSGESGSWSWDITGDHTWGNEYGEVFSSAASYSYPQKGIMLVRMNANGGSGQMAFHNGSSWSEKATWSSLPSSLPSNFDSINIFNFQGGSGNHDYVGTICEIAYYKGTRISDTERDAFTTYALSKFW
tara:strand:+ start:999 stop:1871 length:873 start_codon:yes stop_codon:yes gene_type:complete